VWDEGVRLVHDRAGIHRQHHLPCLTSKEMARTPIESGLAAEDPDQA
jgi:hypothetical protein